MGKQHNVTSWFVLAALWPLAAEAQVAAVAELPTPAIGDVWKFRRMDMWNNKELSVYEEELVEIRTDRLVFRTKSQARPEPRTTYSGRALASCRKMRDSDVEMCEGALAFPLQVGNKSHYDKRPWRSGEGHSSADCEVKAIESVTVPAGTFDAFRVDCDGSYQRVTGGEWKLTTSGRFEETLWYAPAVSNFVKWIYTDYYRRGVWNKEQTELLEFTRK